MAAIEPMHQFMIQKIVSLPPVTVPGVGAIDLSITNSVATMMGAAALITAFFLFSSRGAVVPGRMQALAETVYDLVDKGLTGSMIGDRGRPFPRHLPAGDRVHRGRRPRGPAHRLCVPVETRVVRARSRGRAAGPVTGRHPVSRIRP